MAVRKVPLVPVWQCVCLPVTGGLTVLNFFPALLAQVRVHERTHSGERPYQCRFCDYRASQSGNMAAHERRHTGEKPYPCPYVLIFVRVDVGGAPVILSATTPG
jgi:hypothetical protein